jgi:hypothetical protein
MLENLIVLSNLVTVGNILSVATLGCAGVYAYYKIRRYIARQHHEFMDYLKTLTNEQTQHLEECIHKIPAHPENTGPAGGVTDSVTFEGSLSSQKVP